MTQTIPADRLDLAAYLKPGDSIVFGQACGEQGALAGTPSGLASIPGLIGKNPAALRLNPEKPAEIGVLRRRGQLHYAVPGADPEIRRERR